MSVSMLRKSVFNGATIKGKNMLPIGSIFFPLRVAPIIRPLREHSSSSTAGGRYCLNRFSKRYFYFEDAYFQASLRS